MPTPADQVRTKATGEVKAQADVIESILEDHISRGAVKVTLSDYQGLGYSPPNPLGYGFLPHGTSLQALQEVKRRYENEDWTVRMDTSQRDGMFITIDAKGST